MPHQGRPQVQDPNSGTSVITPQARPVDAFIVPNLQRPSTNTELFGLAEGLSALVPSLQNFANFRRETQQEEDQAADEAASEEGEALFRRTRVAYADAVRRGVIPAGANPYLGRAYRVAELKSRGMSWGQELQQAWVNSPARNSDNPEDYQAFIQEHTQAIHNEFQGVYSASELNDGFAPEYDRVLSVLQSQHTAHRINDNEQRALTSAGTLVANVVNAFAAQPVDPDSEQAGGIRTATAAAISQNAVSLIETGIGGRVVNRLVVDALIAQAESLGRTDILDLADEIRTGSGVLSGIPEHLSNLQAARTRIEEQGRADENHAYTRVQRETKAAGDRIIGRTVSFLIENGGARDEEFTEALSIMSQLVAEGSLSPSVLSSMNNFQRQLAEAEVVLTEDPEDIVIFSEQLRDPNIDDGYERILGWAAAGRLTPGGTRSLIAHYERHREFAPIFNSAVYRETANAVEGIVRQADQFNIFGTARRQALIPEALNFFGGRVATWARENPELARDTSPGSPFNVALLGFFAEIVDHPLYRVGDEAREPEVLEALQNAPVAAPAPEPVAAPVPDAPPQAGPPALPPSLLPTRSPTRAPGPTYPPGVLSQEELDEASIYEDRNNISAAQTEEELIRLGEIYSERHGGNRNAWLSDPLRNLLHERWEALYAAGAITD